MVTANFPLPLFNDRSLRDHNLHQMKMQQSKIGDSTMADQEEADTRLQLARLRQEHEDYDVAINAMIKVGCDALRIQRMKKKKLAIKDRLSSLEDQMIPDIIA